MSLCRKPPGVNSDSSVRHLRLLGLCFLKREEWRDQCDMLWALLLCRVSASSHVMTSRVTSNMSRDRLMSCNVYMCPALTRRCSMAALFDVRGSPGPCLFPPGVQLPDTSSGQNKTIKIWLIKILCGDWGLEKLCWVNPQQNFQHWKLLTVISKTFHLASNGLAN